MMSFIDMFVHTTNQSVQTLQQEFVSYHSQTRLSSGQCAHKMASLV